MMEPKGFNDRSGRVYKLQNSLHCLKQASRCWNKKFKEFIENFGFVGCASDSCVFVTKRNGRKIILSVYVDDGLIFESDEQDIDIVIALEEKFEMRIVNSGSFLGMEIQRLPDGSLFLHQSNFVTKFLKKFGLEESLGVSTPCDVNQSLYNVDNPKTLLV